MPEKSYFSKLPKTIEHFSSRLEVHASDQERGTFTGIASVTGNLIYPQPPSNVATFFWPGCWIKTLNENASKIKVYKGHEELIGRMLTGAELSEGALQFSGKISATTDGNDTLELMRDQALTELSVAWVPMQVELLSGKDLLERLKGAKLRMEVASRIRNNVEEYGVAERYRVVYQARLYHVGIVEEGADDMTAITEVHEKIIEATNIVEKLGAITADAIAEEMLQLAQMLVQVMQPIDPGKYSAMTDTEKPYAMMSDLYMQFSQARYICSVIATMADMPAAMAEEMSKAPTSEIEKEEGRVLSTKSMSTIKSSHDALAAATSALADAMATLKGLIDAAEPSASEADAKEAALTERPQAIPASLIERRKQIRSAQIASAILKNQEMQNATNSKGASATTR